MVLVLDEVGGDEPDLTCVECIAASVVTGVDLVKSFLNGSVIFEFEDVDVARGEDLEVGVSLVAVMLGECWDSG